MPAACSPSHRKRAKRVEDRSPQRKLWDPTRKKFPSPRSGRKIIARVKSNANGSNAWLNYPQAK